MNSRARAAVVLAIAAVWWIVAATSVRRQLRERDPRERSKALAVSIAAAALTTAALAVLVFRWRRGRPAEFSGGWGKVLFYSLVASLAANFAFLQPYRSALLLAAFAAGGGFFALCALVSPWRSRLPRLVGSLDVVAMNLSLIGLAGEAVLRVAAVASRSPIFAQEDAGARGKMDRFRLTPGEMRFGFPANSLGHYDAEFVPRERVPTKHLVASIGDSFGVGIVPHPFHFTTVCEKEFPEATVYNFGICGISPREYAYLLEHEALPLRPDAIVVHLFLENDFEAPSKTVSHLWFDRRNLLVYLLPKRLLKLQDPEERMAGPSHGAKALSEAEVVREFPWVLDPKLEEPILREENFVAKQSWRATQLLGADFSFYEGALRYVEKIRQLAGGRPLLFVLIPATFQVEEDVWRKVSARIGDRSALLDSPQALLGEWFRARGLRLLDLLPVLRAVPPLEDGARHVYHRSDFHFNARGNAAAGKALAAELKRLLE